MTKEGARPLKFLDNPSPLDENGTGAEGRDMRLQEVTESHIWESTCAGQPTEDRGQHEDRQVWQMGKEKSYLRT